MLGMDGFEVARRLRADGDNSVIIFLTGNEDQVFDAFKVEALRYLVKPIDDEKLYEAVDAAIEKIVRQKRLVKKYIFIRHDGMASRINIADIVFAETYGRKIILHTTNGVYDYYGKLGELSDELGDDFFISHRSYIVNLDHIASFDPRQIRLDDGSKAILSRNRYAEFVRVYSDFIRR